MQNGWHVVHNESSNKRMEEAVAYVESNFPGTATKKIRTITVIEAPSGAWSVVVLDDFRSIEEMEEKGETGSGNTRWRIGGELNIPRVDVDNLSISELADIIVMAAQEISDSKSPCISIESAENEKEPFISALANAMSKLSWVVPGHEIVGRRRTEPAKAQSA